MNKYQHAYIIDSKGKGLETRGGCGYVYTHIYIYHYGTIGEFRAKQEAGLCQPTKHARKHSLCSHLTVQNYITTVYSQKKSEVNTCIQASNIF